MDKIISLKDESGNKRKVPVRVCKQCKFYFPEHYDFCDHKSTRCERINLVTGKIIIIRQRCDTVRDRENFCGKEGKLFIPKESISETLKIWHEKILNWFKT